jgi:hypothetical protein
VGLESVVWLDHRPGITVQDALAGMDISDDEVSNVFLNGRLATREAKLRPNDRLGVFPSNMSLLYC